MTLTWLAPLRARLQDTLTTTALRPDAPLAPLTTLRVGGSATLLIQLATPQEVAATLDVLRTLAVPHVLLGLGSNVVIPDEGFPGVVLRLAGSLTGVTREDAQHVVIGAGMANAHAVRDVHRMHLVGLECVALVPGTLGGAVAMNAGTKHGEIRAVLRDVEVVLPGDAPAWWPASRLEMSYRTTHLPKGAVVTRVRVALQEADDAALAHAKAEILDDKRYRSATQPFKLATSGSIFRNPPGDAAGRLIDVAGLKGTRCGGAVISMLHANWVVNDDHASARDVLTLIARAQRGVAARFGVTMHPEVRYLHPTQSMQAALDALMLDREAS